MTGMVIRLLLKACVPLGLLVGSLSYGLYMQGGDPLALLGRVGGGALDEMVTSGRDAGTAVSDTVDRVTGPDGTQDSATTVHTWVDEHGTRHFSNRPDVAAHAERVELTPDRNLMPAVPVARRAAADDPRGRTGSRVSVIRDTTRAAHRVETAPATTGAALPGIANIAVPDGVDREALLELLR